MRILAGLQGEMAALAGQQRPGAADAVAVVGPAVVVFAVAVLVVAAIDGARRRLDPQHLVDDLDRVGDARIGRLAQAEPDQPGEVERHQAACRDRLAVAVAQHDLAR